jgi:hypothetical protein
VPLPSEPSAEGRRPSGDIPLGGDGHRGASSRPRTVLRGNPMRSGRSLEHDSVVAWRTSYGVADAPRRGNLGLRRSCSMTRMRGPGAPIVWQRGSDPRCVLLCVVEDLARRADHGSGAQSPATFVAGGRPRSLVEDVHRDRLDQHGAERVQRHPGRSTVHRRAAARLIEPPTRELSTLLHRKMRCIPDAQCL